MSDEESEYETSEEEGDTESESEEDGQAKENVSPTKKDEIQEKQLDEKPSHVTIPAKQAAQSKIVVENSAKPEQKTSLSTHQHSSGGRKMTHARKQNLKSLMLNKARQDLKVEAENKAEEKKRVLDSRMEPLANLGGMDESELKELCRDLQNKIEKTDEQRYDIEVKVKKNDQEIEDLNQRIFDLRGKFKRPPLRRVRMSADQMLRALLGSKHKVSMDLRSNLKSVKKEESKKEDQTIDWRENVEAKSGMSGMKAKFETQEEA
uniref:troponin I, fast skeletal muscle-like isoform X1 n=1 Tax=Styela clava TaxID=7725 RepID=UPI001939863D|nr:troponin I, fast skeletal muscle-like isoform X1 [Styela clava]